MATKKMQRVEDLCRNVVPAKALAADAPLALKDKKGVEKKYGEFLSKVLGDPRKAFVNSGVQVRSQRVKGSHEMVGYQADLGDGFWGSLYDESRRNRVLAAADQRAMRKALRPGGWNEYVVRAEGRRIRTWLNGVPGADYTEADGKIPQAGRVGLQIHGGGPAEVWFKDIAIEELKPAK